MPDRLRPFSIFLLKNGYDDNNSIIDYESKKSKIKNGNEKPIKKLVKSDGKSNIPDNSCLYILDAPDYEPWWKDYFGLEGDYTQKSKGAILFLSLEESTFALTFGNVYHHLKDESYEYDFGLKVTLNAVNPKALRSADIVTPGPSKRRRTQVPTSAELTQFDFDKNSEVLKSISGAVDDTYKELFKSATGSASLKVNLKIIPAQLHAKCSELLQLYKKDDYKTKFPNIENVVPIKDPKIVNLLDKKLIEDFRVKSPKISLSLPEVLNYSGNTCCVFTGYNGSSDVYPDASIEKLYEYLGEDFEDKITNTEKMKVIKMMITDMDGKSSKPPHNLHKCISYDTEINDDGYIYHICDGEWYKFEKSFVERMTNYLDSKCAEAELFPYDHDEKGDNGPAYSEGNYNIDISEKNKEFVLLDKKDISLKGDTAVEPCDLYKVEEDTTSSHDFRGVLYHVKISTRSSSLSHLFNQGVNSVELLKLEEESRNKMISLIKDNLNGNDENKYIYPIANKNFRVSYCIITHKSHAQKSENLPLFSRLSLMRCMRSLDLFTIDCRLSFIEDQSPAKDGHPDSTHYIVKTYKENGKIVVRANPGQDIDPTKDIFGCSNKMKNNYKIGTEFRLRVNKNGKNDVYRTFHDWGFEEIK